MEGEDFTEECSNSLSMNFYQKAVEMVPSLNSMLGQDLCPNLAVGEVEILYISTYLKTTGDSVSYCTGANTETMDEILCYWS